VSSNFLSSKSAKSGEFFTNEMVNENESAISLKMKHVKIIFLAYTNMEIALGFLFGTEEV
jgi:hypothetical protein